MESIDAGNWRGSWAWSLPLIVLTVLIHVLGLQFINDRVVRVLSGAMARRRFIPLFAAVMGVTALLATILHGVEVTIWALVYRHRRFTQRQGCDAVFAQRNDKLRP